MIKKKRFGEFLKCLLNLKSEAREIREFLGKCNEIIPIENLEMCKALIIDPKDKSEIDRICSKLPTKEQAKDGEFFVDGRTIGVKYTHHSADDYIITTESSHGGGINQALGELFDDIESLKTAIHSLIKLMATCSSLSELSANSTLMEFATNYPPSELEITRNAIEKKPRGPKVWSLHGDYLRQCTSYAFFEFFLEDANINRIKSCPICFEFFIAEDLKREKCYTEECRKEHERLKKRKQREDDPEKYY